MRKQDLTNVEESNGGDFPKLPAGGYVLKITYVEDVPLNAQTGKGDYLSIYYDIAEGDYKGFYDTEFDNKYPFTHRLIRSYKEAALGMFKAFINRVEESNDGYVFDWNESSLEGKVFGAVIGEVENEYNGKVSTRLEVRAVKSVDDIRSGNFTVPELKKADGSKPKAKVESTYINDADVPF